MEKAAELSPRDAWPLQNLVFNYVMLRRFDKAMQTVDRGLQLQPHAITLLDFKANLAIAVNGDFSVGEKIVSDSKSWPLTDEERLSLAVIHVNLLSLQRKWAELRALVESYPDAAIGDATPILEQKYFALGLACKELGDEAAARAALLRAKELCEKGINEPQGSAAHWGGHIELARVLALLGDKQGALAEAQRAADLLPESKDAFDGPKVTEQVATIFALTGENERAIDLLVGLLNRPSDVTVSRLQIDPTWDGLRNDPRFQALLAKPGAKT